jgi:hypothetical protein
MDRQSALNLARTVLPDPGQRLKLNAPELKKLGLTTAEQTTADSNHDQALSQSELAEAIYSHQLTLHSTAPAAKTSLAFVEDPPTTPPKRRPERPDAFLPGATTLGISDPSRPLQVNNASAAVNTTERNLDKLASEVKTPDQVAALLDAVNYDTERGKPLGGDGPLGAQAPEATLQTFSGVCRDIHQLGAYLLNQNGYEAVQVGYVAGRTSHSILAYAQPGAGYGIVEYGRNYTPEDIAKRLGRPALSPREALLALRPEAKVIFGWTPPAKGQEGSVKDIYYTLGHQLYQESLRLKHQDHVQVDSLRGLEIEKTLGKHWSFKVGARGDSPADPTGKQATSVAAGYQWGNFDNWGRVSLGVQHRPHEGSHVVGPNSWEPNPTTLLGASFEGKYTPFKAQLGSQHRTSTTLSGGVSGAFAAFNDKKESDAGVRVNAGYGYDSDLLTGLPQVNLRLAQNFEGQLTSGLSYQASAFMDNDLYLAAAAYGMGGKSVYANVGVNGSLAYQRGPWSASLGAQFLLHQVNNLESSGVKAAVGYKSGRVSFSTGAQVSSSPEGVRVQTRQQLGFDVTDSAQFYLQAAQEQIWNDKIGRYTNPGSLSAGAGLQVRF